MGGIAGHIQDMENDRLVTLIPDPLAGCACDACGRSNGFINVAAGLTTVRRLKEAGGPGGLVFGNVGLFSRTPDAIGISDMHQAAAVLSPALQTLELEKQGLSRRSRGGSLMHGAGAGEEGQNR